MRLYKVDFVFSDAYSPKAECIRNIELIVAAEDQFKALAVAWERIKVLDVPEPKSFTASRIDDKNC